jgi:hypothetical protein
MAGDLRISVSREVARIRREIDRKSSELASLRDSLKQHLRVSKLLGTDNARKSGARKLSKRGKLVDWNALLKSLSNTFTLDELAKNKSARGKSRPYLHQVLVRWGKQGKVKRVSRGKYQKR